MRKYLLIPFLLCFSYYGFTQANNYLSDIQKEKLLKDSISFIKKQINDIDIKLKKVDSVYKSDVAHLKESLGMMEKNIDDSQLKGTLKSAENTINYQNSFIVIFEVIFGLIAFLAGFLYFFSIRPLTNQANAALSRVNSATDKLEDRIAQFDDQVDNKINKRFDLHKTELKEKQIIEIFTDIGSNLQNQRRLQIERLTRGDIDLTSEHIDALFKVLDKFDLPAYEKITIIEILIQKNNFQIRNYFTSWKNVKKEETDIINLLYKYYMDNEIENFIHPIYSIIFKPVEPHLEFMRLLDMLPSHPACIIVLVNSKLLIDSFSNYSRDRVIDHIESGLKSWNLVDVSKVKLSYLFSKRVSPN